MEGLTYLDNAATTFKKPDVVYEYMDKINRNMSVNAHRGSYKLANEAESIINDTRDKILKLANADGVAKTIFTPSATYALNQILYGLVNEGDVIYVTPYEHNAVLRTVNLLCKEQNIKMIEIPIDENDLSIDIDKMNYMFSKNRPSVVCASGVSNVTGYILPVENIFRQAKKHGAVTILDGAQSFGLVDTDVKKVDVDFLVFAGHKTLYGPFGAAGYINVNNTQIKEKFVGGTGSDSLNLNMPNDEYARYEVGSPNIVAIAGLNKALDTIKQKEIFAHEKEITKYLISRLEDIDEVKLYLPGNLDKHISIVSFTLNEYKSADVGMILDEDYNIAVRTGYHCAGLIHKYLKDEVYLGTVRASIGRYTKREEIDRLVGAIEEIVE